MDKDGALQTLVGQLGRVRAELDHLEAQFSIMDRESAFQEISAERIRAILQARRHRDDILVSLLITGGTSF